MSRHSQFFRAMAGFLLFLLLQLPAYSQSSLSGLQECSKPANASVCADLFGVKNALISANAPGTNAAVQLVGRIGSQAKTVANINVGGLVNSKAGMSVAAAGVAGLGAASLWGISADRLDGLRETAFNKYCSINQCSPSGTLIGSGLGTYVASATLFNGKHYITTAFGNFTIPQLSLPHGGKVTVGLHWTGSNYLVKLYTDPNRYSVTIYPGYSSNASFSLYSTTASLSNWSDLSAVQKGTAADLLTATELASTLKGRDQALPYGFDSFDLVLGAGVGAHGVQSAAGDRAIDDSLTDGASDEDKPLDSDLTDLNGDGVIDSKDQTLRDAQKEQEREEEKEENRKGFVIPEPLACEGKTRLVPYAICELQDDFPFDLLGDFSQFSGTHDGSCPSFEFFGQELEFCFLNQFFLAVKWIIWIRFSIWSVTNL